MIPVNEGDEKCYACKHFYESYGCIPTYNDDFPPCGRKVIIGGKIMTKNDAMLNKAKQIVVEYFNSRCDRTDNFKLTVDDVFIVWFSKTLQNWKALVSTTVSDGMYYEVTYNGDKKEWYLDAYKKFENKCIHD